MKTEETSNELLSAIRDLSVVNKKVLNVEDLAKYTGLSKSKIYKLTQLKLIPTNDNPYIRQLFFDKDVIDAWLMGQSEETHFRSHEGSFKIR